MAWIAVDFDGTVVSHRFPLIGKDIGAVPVLKKLVKAGHGIILNTMRCDETLDIAIGWFKKNNIPLYGINNNPSWKTGSPKVYAHYYIDDCGLGMPLIHDDEPRPYVNWKLVEILLKKENLI